VQADDVVVLINKITFLHFTQPLNQFSMISPEVVLW